MPAYDIAISCRLRADHNELRLVLNHYRQLEARGRYIKSHKLHRRKANSISQKVNTTAQFMLRDECK
jgi:hypothetical protein